MKIHTQMILKICQENFKPIDFASRKACGKGCTKANVKCNSGSICRNKSTELRQQRLFFTLNHFVVLD